MDYNVFWNTDSLYVYIRIDYFPLGRPLGFHSTVCTTIFNQATIAGNKTGNLKKNKKEIIP